MVAAGGQRHSGASHKSPTAGISHVPESWSPDGEVLLFSATKDSISSLWTYSLRDRKATPFSDVKGSSLPTNATFSPDGHWVAYQFKEPGSAGTEGVTYVEPFPPTGKKNQIVQGGRPMWSRDGKELFCRAGTGAVHGRHREDGTELHIHESGRGASWIRRSPSCESANIRRLVGRPFRCRRDTRAKAKAQPGPTQIHVVLNWFEELKRLVPTK